MPSTPTKTMPANAKTKNGHAPKVCEACGLEFEWRKKWERDWELVRYCSERCKGAPKHRVVLADMLVQLLR